MRCKYNKGELDPVRTKQLEDIGFVFHTKKYQWQYKYELYKQYVEQKGTSYISEGMIYEGERLGEWLVNQLQRYKKGILAQERLILLREANPIAFGEDGPPDYRKLEWMRRYEQYKRYIAETGSPIIRHDVDFEGEHLGKWVLLQQHNYKIGKLSEDRIRMMNMLDSQRFVLK